MIEAKVIADSISPKGKRITTMQLKYQRFIHSEFMTHRVFSRNASSSRAVPVAKMIEQVRNDPATPVHWGKNQAGMQAYVELEGIDKEAVQMYWKSAAEHAATSAELMSKLGAHKQVVNRILEPFQWIHVVVTATEWDNFFALRDHPAAQPEIQELARQMKAAMQESTPKNLSIGEWHLPYIRDDERLDMLREGRFNDLKKMSAARCARVSYLTHDGENPDLEKDIELFNQLVTRPYTDKRGMKMEESDPIHASPTEHQATPSLDINNRSGNFIGWIQYRQQL